MTRSIIANATWTVFLALVSTASLRADVPQEADEDAKYDLKYKFQTGDVIRYEVDHRMSVRNTIDGKTQEAASETSSIKVWKIVDVLPEGNIELINLVERVRMKNQLPGKAELEFDSDSDEAPPPGFEDAAKAVGMPISVVRITPWGKLLKREMKLRQPAADPDAPVGVLLPKEPVSVGATWNEPLDVNVQSKDGGQKAVQTRRHYKLTSVKHGIATIEVTYQVLSPISAHVEAQLVQRLLNGTVRFDMDAGRIASQQMDVDKRVLGYAGPTSSMHYVMRMEEKLLDEVPEVARKD